MPDRPQTSAQPESPATDDVEAGLRELLWLRHGCPISALYGDDGEMQCSRCGVDFKRDPVEQIEATWREEGEEALRRAREGDSTEDEGPARQRTTEEVVHETIANFLRQRVEHHERMADMVTEPFAGDHRELARAFEERRQGGHETDERPLFADATLRTREDGRGEDYPVVAWAYVQQASSYMGNVTWEARATALIAPEHARSLLDFMFDGLVHDAVLYCPFYGGSLDGEAMWLEVVPSEAEDLRAGRPWRVEFGIRKTPALTRALKEAAEATEGADG